MLKKLFKNRNALSKLVITVIVVFSIIVVLLSAFLGVYFTIPQDENPPQKSKFYINIVATSFADSNKDSRFDQFTFTLNNNYSSILTLYNVTIRVTSSGNLSDSASWSVYNNWHLPSFENITLNPSENKEISLEGNDQIELSVFKEYYCSVLFYNDTFSGTNKIISNWFLLNNCVSLSDLISSYLSLDLQAAGFVGTIDVPGWPSNNYMSTGGPEYGPLLPEQNIYLPVINEPSFVKFYYTGKITIFHSLNGNLTSQPTEQSLNYTTNTFRAQKIFLLGLAGSWGDEFPTEGIALTLNITYTDGRSDIWDLSHEYIDDWWYNSNDGDICTSESFNN